MVSHGPLGEIEKTELNCAILTFELLTLCLQDPPFSPAVDLTSVESWNHISFPLSSSGSHRSEAVQPRREEFNLFLLTESDHM